MKLHPKTDYAATQEADIKSVFSQISNQATNFQYQEILHQNLALDAANSWPLLSEILHIKLAHPVKEK